MLIQEQFITPELCRELISAFRQVSDTYGPADKYVRRWPYRTAITGPTLNARLEEPLKTALTDLRQRAADEVCKFFNVNDAMVDFTLFTEMMFGDYHPLHADNEVRGEDGKWVPNHTSFHHCAAVLYLNTSGDDYRGGLVRVPSLQVEIAPRTGLLLGFMCGHDYEHEVTAIEDGQRYTVAIWLTRDPAHAERWSRSPGTLAPRGST